MKNVSTNRVTLAIASAAFTFASQAQTAVPPPPLRIGVVVSATGAAAGLGTAARTGALLAQKQINAAGGRQVQLLLRDDATNPDTALTHANELVRTEKVDVLVALTTTASSISIGGVTSATPTPQISLS